MALGTFVQSQTGSEITGTGTYTTAAFGSSVTVGNIIVVSASSDGNSASQITNITDSKGNTYTKQFEQLGTARMGSMWTTKVTTGGTGLTVTVTYNSASSNNSGVVFQEFTGPTGTLTKDQSLGANGTSATPSVGPTGTTTNANELVVAFCVMTSTEASFTAGTGYTNGAAAIVSNANIGMQSKLVTSTGTQTAGFTWPTSRVFAAAIVTFSDGGGTPTNTTNFFFGFQGNAL